MSDPISLLRFYNAQGKDVEKAAAMFRDTNAWRANFSLATLMSEYGTPGLYNEDGTRKGDLSEWKWRPAPSSARSKFASRHAFFEWLKRDGDEPILFWQCGAADYKGYVREEMVSEVTRAWVAHLEDVLQASRVQSKQQKKMVRARLVVDANGFGVGNLRYISILRDIIALGKAYFPELTASVTVVRAPWAAAQGYKLIKPFLTPLIQSKIQILGSKFEEGLVEHSGLDLDILPNWIGGKDPNFKVTEPVPEGGGKVLTEEE